MRFILLAILGILLHQLALAQSVSTVVHGRVVDCINGAPLEAVAIQLSPVGGWTASNVEGEFSFHSTEGRHTLHATLVGRHPVDTTFVSGAGATFVEVRMCPNSLYLDEIVVTAREESTGSVSLLRKTALEHVQPTSVFDALQLLPGQLASNPNLGNAQQLLLRQAPTNSAANRANALGTSVIVDGAPVSNNANMQLNNTILNSSAGASPPFSSVAGQGVDLRQIPADQIESIEVIRGIPSARYGDATAGMIIINSKTGIYKPSYRFRVNPTLMQNAFGTGFRWKRSTINYDADITAAKDDPRDDVNRYQRLNQQLAWSQRFLQDQSLHVTTRLSHYRTLDESRNKSSDASTLSERYARDQSIRLNANIKWSAERTYLKTLSLNTTANYGRQTGWFQDLITRDIFPISTAVNDTTQTGVYGKSEYLNQTRVEGRPASLYGRFEMNFVANAGASLHELVAGSEWRSEGNRGEGRQFDLTSPPRQNYSVGERPRTYRELPFLHQASAYIEDRFRVPIGDVELVAVAGIRSDVYKTDQWRTVFNPRFNVSLKLNNGFSARAGYGHTSKMPTLAFLYPAPTFYDLVNFNYYASNPAERLVIVTTRKIVPPTENIRAYTSRKVEAGIDHTKGNASTSLVVFSESTAGAFQYQRDLSNLRVDKFGAVAFPPGAPPVLGTVPVRIDTFMAAYDRPVNSLAVNTRGAEFTINISEWPLKRISMQWTGGYLYTVSTNEDEYLNTDQAVFSNQASGRVAIFSAGQGQATERFSTAARFICHIPSFGLVVSSLVQNVWIDNTRLVGYDETPIAYFNRKSQRIPISPEQAGSTEFNDLRRNVDEVQLEWQRRPVLWLFNMRLAKEWRPRNGFAFYVNNVFNTNPLYTSRLTGYKLERNQPDLFFGAEIYLSL